MCFSMVPVAVAGSSGCRGTLRDTLCVCPLLSPMQLAGLCRQGSTGRSLLCRCGAHGLRAFNTIQYNVLDRSRTYAIAHEGAPVYVNLHDDVPCAVEMDLQCMCICVPCSGPCLYMSRLVADEAQIEREVHALQRTYIRGVCAHACISYRGADVRGCMATAYARTSSVRACRACTCRRTYSIERGIRSLLTTACMQGDAHARGMHALHART